MKKTTLFLQILILSLCVGMAHAQTYLTKAEALEDIAYFFEQAEQIHPNLYAKTSRQEMEKYIHAFEEELGEQISVNDFSRRLCALANRLGDGHTGVSFSESLRQRYREEKTILPFEVQITDEGIFVKSSRIAAVSPGDRILAINGVPDTELMKLIKYPSADLEAMRHEQLQKFFSYYLFAEYEFTNEVELNILRAGEAQKIKIPLWARTEFGEHQPYSYRSLDGGVGVLKLNTFSGLHRKEYKAFLEQTFAQIHQENISTLIIDLRDNGGGNSARGIDVFPYLGITKFRFHQKYQIKTSKAEKKYFRKHYIKWYMYPFYPFALLSKTGRTLLFKKNGSITDMDTSEGELKPGSSALVFDKEVCVLTSHYTFSAAADFVAAFSYAKRGKVIGDVLGQPYSGFIDIIFFELPNSGLRARASFKYYEFTGTTEANKHEGIAPDLLLDVNAYETEEALYQAVVKKVTKVTF